MLLTFDLNADLVLISPRDVADDTKVGSLVHNFNALYLQSPVTVGLKAVSFKISLPILRPAGGKKPQTDAVNFFRHWNISPHVLTISAQAQENQKNDSLGRRDFPLLSWGIRSWNLKYVESHLEKNILAKHFAL